MASHDLRIPVQRLDPELALPAYARPGDAGLDLCARDGVVLAPAGGRALVPTGVAMALPDGFVGLVMPRSGLAARHGVTLVNTPGVIDAGYRGELKVVLINTDPTAPYEVHRGDRIAQLLVMRMWTCELDEVDELPGEHRGGGFGHTGR